MTRKLLPWIVVAALCALPALAPQPASAQPQGVPQPDLAVTQLAITGPVPGWTNGVGNRTTVAATVTNLGAAAASYELDYYWVDPNGFRFPLNEDSKSSIDYGEPLEPGESRTLPVPWRLQPGQAGNGSLEAHVLAFVGTNAANEGEQAIERDYDNNLRRLNVFVPVHRMSFSMPNVPAVAPPDGEGFFRVSAQNLGNVAEDVVVRVVEQPGESRLHPEVYPPVLTVPAGGRANAILFVRYIPAGDFTPFSVRYTLEVDAGLGMPERFVTPTLSNGSATPPPGFGFSIHADVSTMKVAQGATTPWPITVENTGTRPDTFAFEILTEDDWTAVPEPARLALYPDETATVTFKVQPPASAAPGSAGAIRVAVRDGVLDPVFADLQATVVGPAATVEVLRLDDPLAYVGESPAVLVTVANRGDQASPDGGALTLAAHVPGAPPQFVEARVSRLASGESTTHIFHLDALPAGGTARLLASVQGAQGAVSPTVESTFFVRVPRLDLHVPQPLDGGPGEALSYRVAPHAFRLFNVGNAAETIVVEATASAGTAKVEGADTYLLVPGESRTLSILHLLPRPLDGREAANLTVTARLAGRAEHAWSATVTTILRDAEAPRLSLGAPPPAVWALHVPLPLDLVAEDDDRVVSANATVTDPSGNHTVVALAPRGDGHWTADLPLAKAGNHTILFNATDPAGHGARALAFTVDAQNVPPPRLRLEGLNESTALNGTDRLRLAIDDDWGVANVTLEIRQGDEVLHRDLAVTAGVVEFDLAGAAPGPVNVTLTVRNAAGAAAVLSFDAEVLPPPQASVTPPASHDAPAPAGAAALALLGALLRRRRRRRGDVP